MKADRDSLASFFNLAWYQSHDERQRQQSLIKNRNHQNMTFKYDLNSNDNPRNIITQVQLKGDNYEEWAQAMRTSLRARRKWSFIEGLPCLTQPVQKLKIGALCSPC